VARDESRMARDESRMTRDKSRMNRDYCRPEESIHRCVRTQSHLYSYIYGLVALLDYIQSSFSSITISTDCSTKFGGERRLPVGRSNYEMSRSKVRKWEREWRHN